MAQTSIKAAQFSGVVGNGESGYVLQSSGNGDMSWVASITPPTVTSLSYPGSATAADPAGGQTVTITGTGFASGATVTVGGTAAPAVSFVSATTLTITTPAKAAGDYDVVVTNTDTGSATFINGISYNGIPAWTTAAGSLGTFASAQTISTITLQATEPDAGTITFNITNGALPTGLSLTGANIDGTTSLETAETLYTFTVTATDDESQTTPRTFTITVKKEFKSYENFTINTYTGNGSTLAVEGKIGTAADFNGSSSYIYNTSTSLWSSNISISAWFKTTINQRSPIVQIGRGSWTDGFELQAPSANTVAFSFAEGSKYGYFNSSIDLDDGNWHHYVQVSNSSTAKFFIDGVEQTGITTGNGNSRQGSGIRIGRFFQTPEQWANGSIDQVRIFDKAISSSEVTTLYGESNTSTTKSTTDIFDDGSGVALYEFEKGAIDTGGVSGYIGNGGMFNGSSSKVELPNNSFKYTTFSVSAWIYSSDYTQSLATLYSFYDNDGANGGGFIGVNNDTLCFFGAGGTSSPTNTNGSTTLTDSTWYHVCLVISATSVNVYLNGNSTPDISLTLGSNLAYRPTHQFAIGARDVGTNTYGYFNGKIDQVRIFNKALSSSEVTTLYNETSASTTKSTTDIFDDGSGVALYELEGNANTTPYYPYGEGAIDAGQSAVFNGSSSKVDLPNGFFDNNVNHSFSFWVFFNDAPPTSEQQIFFAGEENFRLQTNGTLKFRRWTGSGNDIDSYVVSENQWYHITCTYNTVSGMVLYINGTSVDTNSSTTNVSTSVTRSLGYRGDNNTSYFNGKIDQVRIYDTTLSQSDVEALVSETNVPTANLVAHYKLDGDATDETGSYNGTATSLTYSDPAENPSSTEYNGTATNVSYAYDGTPTNVSFVGTSFQPDLVWIKNRDNIASQFIHDSVRGIDNDHYLTLITNETFGESTFNQSWHNSYGRLSNISSNGFTINQGSVTSETSYNKSGDDYVAWCWKAGGAATSNTDGTITSTVSANQDAGFSIVGLTIPNANTQSVGHGLNSAPEMIIMKARNSAESWLTYHSSVGLNKYLLLNSNAAEASYSGIWPNVNSSTFTTIYHVASGSPTRDVIAYCFHSVDGYQKIDSYTGTGAAGNTVTTGFEPRFLMIKRSNNSGNWFIYDNKRGSARYLNPDLSNIEGTDGGIVFNSNGFTINVTYSDHNTSGGEYIYLAIA